MNENFHWAGAGHLLLLAAERLGVERGRVFEQAKLKDADLPLAPLRMPWEPLRALATAALELTGEAGLGLLAGKIATIHFHGPIGAYKMHLSPARASQRFAYEEAWPRLSNVVRLNLEDHGDLVRNRMDLQVPADPAAEAMLHIGLSQHVAAYRALFGGDARIDHMALSGVPAGDPAHLSALADCPVRTGQPGNWVAVLRDLVDRPMPLADPWVRDQLRPQIDAMLRLMDDRKDTTLALHAIVERAVMAGDSPTLMNAARAMHTNARSLRARLARENSSFSGVLDQVRKESALRQLAVPGVKLATVGAQLGFCDAAAFTRAFRRWTGATPSQWLEQIAS